MLASAATRYNSKKGKQITAYFYSLLTGKSGVRKALKRHFRDLPLEQITTAARTFPLASRVDVQNALGEYFTNYGDATLLGIHSAIGHETPTLAHLFTRGPWPVDIGPLQHDDIDLGDAAPADP